MVDAFGRGAVIQKGQSTRVPAADGHIIEQYSFAGVRAKAAKAILQSTARGSRYTPAGMPGESAG